MSNYKTKLVKADCFKVIEIMRCKTKALRAAMEDAGITINHVWPARQFSIIKTSSTVINTQNLYGRDIWPIYIECNAYPEQLVALHEEILADDSVEDCAKFFNADESRKILEKAGDIL